VTPKRFLSKIAVYLTGLFLLALGTVLSINAELGISPVNALPYATSIVLGTEMGISLTAFFIACMLLQVVLLGRRFRPVDLCQVPFSFVLGYFIQGISLFMGDFSLKAALGYPGQLVMLLCGMFLVASGIAVYIEAALISLPPEGLVLAILERRPASMFGRVKIGLDSILVLLAVAVSLAFTGTLHGVREGTVISILLVGRLIPMFRGMFVPLLCKIGFRATSGGPSPRP